MFFVSVKFFIVLTTVCVPLFKLIQTYTTIITTITICSFFLSTYNLFVSHTCTLFCTYLRCSNTQLHNSSHSSVSSVLRRRKSKRKPSPTNTVVETWLRFCFASKTHAQATMCELMDYNGSKCMIGFCTILYVFDELFCIIGA